jgi:hypothetical protein
MLKHAGCKSLFVSATPVTTEAARDDDWYTEPLATRRARDLTHQLTRICDDKCPRAVILHVCGYGYQRRGVPLLLLRGMRRWRSDYPRMRLIGIFHELFATGQPWNSSFWLSGAQSYITRELWELCDRGLTTNVLYFNQLTAWRPRMRDQLAVLPISSNVGEPELIVPYTSRPATLAVFGGPGTEQGIYLNSALNCSEMVVDALGIRTVFDMGDRLTPPPQRLGKAIVMQLGRLAASSISEYLKTCRFGLLNYDTNRLGKSGVFAAYAAHGVIPICIGAQTSVVAGQSDVKENYHFLRWPCRRDAKDLSDVQTNLVRWYREHSVLKHADLLSRWSVTDSSQTMQHDNTPKYTMRNS